MSILSESSITVFAPAKINLYLHITGRLASGYHTLESLVAFADVGDVITITESDHFHFETNGPFSDLLPIDPSEDKLTGDNLAVRAVKLLSDMTGTAPNVSIRLTKNLPVGAGLGGGSSDAAAVLLGLSDLWEIPPGQISMKELADRLGADAPVCFYGYPTYMHGIGEILDPVSSLPHTPVVLVYPNIFIPTEQIFKRFRASPKEDGKRPKHFDTSADLIGFLKNKTNDLTDPALSYHSDIQKALKALSNIKECLLSRMSGSGSSCFGLFSTEETALEAAQKLQNDFPDWWIKPARLIQ